MKATIKLINGGPMCIPGFDKLICLEAAHAQSKGTGNVMARVCPEALQGHGSQAQVLPIHSQFCHW